MHVGVGVCHGVHTEDSLQELVFSFYPVGSRDGTWVIMLGGKCLCLLSYHTGHGGFFDVVFSGEA